MDAVVTLLKKYGWKDEGPLKDKTERDLPVYSINDHAVVVVGPLWTTYYRRPMTESEVDSVRTEDLGKVEKVIKSLTRKAA